MMGFVESSLRQAFRGDYASALADYLAGGGRPALTRGREIARRARAAGLGSADVVGIHHDALRTTLATISDREDSGAFHMAGQFLAESLSPFAGSAVRHRDTRSPAVAGSVERASGDLGEDGARAWAAAALPAADAARRDLESFSRSVAHDLRAPLRSIDGFSHVLIAEYAPRLDGRGQEYLGRIRQSAQHMARLIDDLLSLARVSRARLHRAPVNLSALAKDVVGRMRAANPDRRVNLIVADGIVATGDRRLLGMALEHLLGNAWKFSSRRDTACVEFGVRREDDRTVYFVRDNGAGFDMAYVGKLFGIFQRLHAAHEFDGTGIGLAIVQRIVERHGGQVRAEGAVGHGATVYFTLEEGRPA